MLRKKDYEALENYRQDKLSQMMSKYLDKNGELKKQYVNKYGDTDNLRFQLEGYFDDDPNSDYNKMRDELYKKYK